MSIWSWLSISASGALLHPPQPPQLDRRSALLAAASACLLPLSTLPLPAAAISATTMAGKSKAELGCILVEAPQQDGKSVSAQLVLNGGQVADVAYESPWRLAEGNYNDVETKSIDTGDTAFVQVMPGQGSLSGMKKSAFTDAILGSEGRYGAYGAPYNVKVLSDTKDESADSRTLEVSFTALGPMTEVDRRAIVTAKTAKGSRDIVMLISGTQAARWKKGGKEDALGVTSSFRVATRPTDLKAVPSTDYRYGRTSGPSNMKSRNDGF